MKKHQVHKIFRQIRISASSDLDERVHRAIDNAATPPAAAPMTLGQFFALIFQRPFARYTIPTTLGLAAVAALVLIHPAPSAWAMEQTIETLKKYKGLELSGNYFSDGKTFPLDIWLEADPSGDWVEAVRADVGGEATLWTRDNKTFTYVHDDKKVYVEPGITPNLNPWPGPRLLALLPTMKDYRAIEGDDPATGQKRVVVTCVDADGEESVLMEFDVRTKLLVRMKIWPNTREEGTPNTDIQKILYCENLPDSSFAFQPPADVPFTNMPLTVSDTGLLAMTNNNDGISTEGMTREQACQKIIEEYWTATITYDFARFRQLLPRYAGATDECLRDNWKLDGVTKLVKVGGIERTGDSKLGPLALVPSWVRDQTGIVTEIWMIIQFRETNQPPSCVIYGSHGYALNVKE